MKTSSLDILNLEWPNSDRDLHIVIPSLVYLEKKYKITYKTRSIFNAFYYILKYKPKMLVLSNFVGADINYNVAKVAHDMGIKVVSLISEGNFKATELELYLFGKDNIARDDEICVDKYLLWNQKSYNLIVDKYSDLANVITVTGATGFDRYKLLTYLTKEEFLIENSLSYKKIIGIAGWAFGIFFNDDKEYYLNTYGKQQVKMHQDDLTKINIIYKELIVNNPDILFILRYHPATANLSEDEFYDLDQYENVFISKRDVNSQYGISDLINVSDIWIGYETTTALEAWLLGKNTFLINPTKKDFIREEVHIGSVIVKTMEEAQKIINEYFKTSTIIEFENLKVKRDQVIKSVVQYDDGENYKRVAKEINVLLKEPFRQVKYNFKIYKEILKQNIKLILAKNKLVTRWKYFNDEVDFAKPYQEMYDEVIDV